MKIPVDVWVRSERKFSDLSRRGDGERSVSDDYHASGTMKKTKDGYRIEFAEDNDSVITLIDTYDDNSVSVNRMGEIKSHMVFCDSRVHTCICDTGLGMLPIHMRIRTKSLENSLTMDGGKLDIDYSVEIVGNLAEQNRLTFSVAPDKSIIKS